MRVHELDVTRFEAIDALARELRGTALDVLINGAGLFGPKARAEGNPGQVFGSIDYEAWTLLLRVNALAPMKTAEAFVEHVAASGESWPSSARAGSGRTWGGRRPP